MQKEKLCRILQYLGARLRVLVVYYYFFSIFPDVESGEYKIHVLVMRVRGRKTRTICSINELGKRDAANRLVVSDTATKL